MDLFNKNMMQISMQNAKPLGSSQLDTLNQTEVCLAMTNQAMRCNSCAVSVS